MSFTKDGRCSRPPGSAFASRGSVVLSSVARPSPGSRSVAPTQRVESTSAGPVLSFILCCLAPSTLPKYSKIQYCTACVLKTAKVENKPFELCILPTPSEHSSGVAVSSVAVSSVFLISFGCGATRGKGAGSVSGGTAVEVDAGAEGEGKVGARR